MIDWIETKNERPKVPGVYLVCFESYYSSEQSPAYECNLLDYKDERFVLGSGIVQKDPDYWADVNSPFCNQEVREEI